jgi:hypothetical protein
VERQDARATGVLHRTHRILDLDDDSVTEVVVRPGGDVTRLRLTAVPDHGT